MKKIFILILVICLPSASIAEIEYKEILEDPTDIELNLTYAKEHELAGQYKATIITLERLSMLYPVNTDIKLYLLSILLRIDSGAKLELMIETMLQDPNTSEETRDYVLKLLKTIKEKANPQDKWFAYLDFNYLQNENSNIEGLSKTKRQMFGVNGIGIEQDIPNKLTGIKYDKTYTRGGSFTLGKNLDSTSAISFNAGLSEVTQNKGTASSNDLTSASISYSKIFGKHYFLPFAYFSKLDYQNTYAVTTTKGLGFSNSYNVTKDYALTYGTNISDTSINTIEQNASGKNNPNNKNNQIFTVNFGSNYTFFDKNLISTKFLLTKKEAKADYNAYRSPGFNVGLTRLLPFGTFKVDKLFLRTKYDKENLFNANLDREDRTNITTYQLSGKITQLLPHPYFTKIIDPQGLIFYTLKHSKTDTDSTILNYDAITKNTSFNIIKRFNLSKFLNE